jgi:galactitol-specific phosphotransferase system IIB component
MANIETSIKQEIESGQNISVNIRRLASEGKKNVKFIIGEILKKHGADDLLDDIFVTVSELVFNAIKANYKHILIREELESYLKNDNAPHSLKQLLNNKTLYNAYLKKIDLPSVSKKVKDIFRREEEATKILNKAEKEERELNPDEKNTVIVNMQMMQKAKELNVGTFLNFNFEEQNVIIDIVNDSPISDEDLERIEKKRLSFAKYLREGREQDFYIENLDTMESAGFGFAMIDARLYRQGIDPMRYLNIFGIGKKTCLTLTYPLKKQ